MPISTSTRVYRCQAAACFKVMQPGQRWLVATIDKDNRLIFEKFRDQKSFEESAQHHGAVVVCSGDCAGSHFRRWVAGEITAADQPYCASPAHWNDEFLTCWVSDVYRTTNQFGEARIINYRDDGQKRSIFCFNRAEFAQIEMTAGHYATFRTEKRNTQKGVFTNVVELLKIQGDFLRKGASV